MLPNSIVFCDFDGTITAVDTFAGMIKELAPELGSQILPQLYNRTLTLREGVRRLLEALPSAYYPKILDYAMAQPIRSGLTELIDFLSLKTVPMVVVSGGLRGMVETVLKREGLMGKIDLIFAVDVKTQGEYLEVNCPWEGETELLAKVQIMDLYQTQERIVIGDSVTDINMAMKGDLVFARDRLINYLEEANKPYIPWDNFFEVRDYLMNHWEVSHEN